MFHNVLHVHYLCSLLKPFQCHDRYSSDMIQESSKVKYVKDFPYQRSSVLYVSYLKLQ